MAGRHITAVRAYTLRGGADYHDQPGSHWIDDHVAAPMARYPEYRASRRSFGLDVLGSLLVEVESDDGTVGVGITTGGEIGAWIVEQHLARFVEGAPVTDIERIWDQMFLSTLHYGRKGIVLNEISGVDLALWDLLGQLRDEPVHALLGGAVRDEISFYATGPDPAAAQRLGFIGCKVPLQHGPAEGDAGMRATVQRLQAARDAVGEDFWLMLDCWMSLDGASARRLACHLAEIDVRWIEEPLLPTITGATPSSEGHCRRRCCSPPANTSRHAGASACSSRWNAATSCNPTSAGAADSPSCAASRHWRQPPGKLSFPTDRACTPTISS